MMNRQKLKPLIAVLLIAAVTPLYFAKKLEGKNPQAIEKKYSAKLQNIAAQFEEKKIRGPAQEIKMPTPPPIPIPKPSPKLEKNSDEKVNQAVRQFLENAEKIKKSWADYRVKMYQNAGLTSSDIGTIDQMNTEYESLLEEIQNEYNQANQTAEQYEALSKVQDQIIARQGEEMRRFLGDVRFDYVTGARASFNKVFQDETKSNAETLSW